MIHKNGRRIERGPTQGQSLVEYLLVIGAILVTLLAMVRPGGLFNQAVQETLTKTQQKFHDIANTIVPVLPR